MARIVANFFISLDGVVESPEKWHMPYWDDEMGAVVGAGFERNRAMLMGHRLYDEWAAFWPTSTDEPVATTMNSTPKYVLAHQPFEATWQNTTVLAGEDGSVVEQVRALKETVTGGDIIVSGSATTVRWLIARGLLDELVLLVHPLAVGSGQRLFEDGDAARLRLDHCQALGSGVLHLRYVPDAGEGD